MYILSLDAASIQLKLPIKDQPGTEGVGATLELIQTAYNANQAVSPSNQAGNNPANTIRNLLALNSTSGQKENSTFIEQQQPASSANRLHQHQHQHHKQVLPKESAPSLTVDKTSAKHSVAEGNNNGRNPQISALLSAVLAPKLAPSSSNDMDLIICNGTSSSNISVSTKKRGRKSNIVKAAEEAAAAAVAVANAGNAGLSNA